MNRIREIRQNRNLSVKELAELLHVAPNTVSRYELESRQLDPELINQICDIFGVTADYLLCRSDMPAAALSREEEQLLAAYRKADAHTRAVVDLTLAPYREVAADAAV